MGWNILLAVSLIAIVGAAWVAMMPGPSLAGDPSQRAELVKMADAARIQKLSASTALYQIRDRAWTEDLDAMGSVALDSLNQRALKHNLQLSFRTDKPVDMEKNLQAAPFVVVLTGSFADVLAFVGELEGPKSKLAVNLLQVTASDAAADQVTATVGLLGFRMKGAK